MSLFFGCNAKQVKNNVQKNVESQEVMKLKEELGRLRKKFADAAAYASSGGPMASMLTNVAQNVRSTS
jgi:hypothetical protein